MKVNLEIINKINQLNHQVTQIRILQKQKSDCLNLVLKRLRLKNANELRDRHEGVKFYETYFKQYKCLIALESILKRKIIDWNKIAENPNMIFDDTKMDFQIVCFDYESYPKIDTSKPKDAILFLNKEEMKILVVGQLMKSELSNSDNFLKSASNTKTLIAINKLKELTK